MATTAEESNSASDPAYPELILTAISALGETGGSSKSDIIKYIEATYADTLGEGYTEAISESLTKLKESGELLFENDIYIKPYSNPQPRRGRGRPKKPKLALPPGTSPSIRRPRGRPPKPKDPQSNAVKSVGGISRPRGRPPKPKDPQSNAVKSVRGIPSPRGRPPKSRDPQSNAVKSVGGIPRPRGRPPKGSQSSAVKVKIPSRRGRPPKDSQSSAVKVKIPSRGRPKKLNATNVVKTAGGNARRRGRPPKKSQLVISGASKAVAKSDGTATPVSGVKRGRGRPLKVKPEVADAAAL